MVLQFHPSDRLDGGGNRIFRPQQPIAPDFAVGISELQPGFIVEDRQHRPSRAQHYSFGYEIGVGCRHFGWCFRNFQCRFLRKLLSFRLQFISEPFVPASDILDRLCYTRQGASH
jgi:hypothetical protein